LTVNLAPTVSIISPNPGTTFWRPTNVVVTASASDSDGIARVDFYNGAAWLGLKTNQPYNIIWSNPPAGAHWLSSVATDTLGATGVSAAIMISMTNLPPHIGFPTGNPWSNGSLRLQFEGVPGDTIYV